MPDITLTRQTALRGRELQNAVTATVQELAGRSPYSLINLTGRWESGTRMVLSAPNHMSGAADIREGDPSTVTLQLNLLSSLARNARNSAIRDITAAANRHIPEVGAAPAQPTAPTPTAPGAPAPTTPAPTTRPRRQFDWGLFTDIFSGIAGGAASSLTAYNEAVGYTASEEAVIVAAEEATAAGKGPGVQTGPGFELGPGKPVGPDEPPPGPTTAPTTAPGAPSPTLARPSAGFPTWGWWAIGIAGVGILGVVVLATRKPKDEFEENVRASELSWKEQQAIMRRAQEKERARLRRALCPPCPKC